MKRILKSILFILVIVGAFWYLETNHHILDIIGIRSMSEEDNQSFIEQVRDAMINGKEQVESRYIGSEDALEAYLVSAMEEAFAIDDPNISDDYDYLRYKLAGTHMDMKGIGSSYQVTFTFEYLESREETDQVNKRIEEVFEELEIESMTPYEKVKAIHDYIIDNSTYDMTINRNSAYAALIEESSVCQGYAQLTYKMMTEAGIPCRIITGTADGQPHAWNIVKLDSYWYNIDCTWDNPIGGDKKSYQRYDYFLKSNRGFSQHVRDAEFDTREFNLKYPMDGSAYNPPN